MKQIRNFLVTLFFLSWFAGNAIAIPVVPLAPFYGDYLNLEIVNTVIADLQSAGQEDNWGIAQLGWYDEASISDSGLPGNVGDGFSPVNGSGNPTWSNGDGGKELTAIFYDIDVVDFDLTSGDLFNGNYTLNSIGGKMDIYLNDAGTLGPLSGVDASDRIGGAGSGLFAGVTDHANSELWLSLEFVAYDSTGGGGVDRTIYGGGFSIGGAQSNVSSSYLSVTGGSMAALFDTDYWTLTKADGTTVTADLHNKNSFDAFNARGWNATSEDPVEGFTAVIPEPATFFLFGIGLLGFAGITRKKTNN